MLQFLPAMMKYCPIEKLIDMSHVRRPYQKTTKCTYLIQVIMSTVIFVRKFILFYFSIIRTMKAKTVRELKSGLQWLTDNIDMVVLNWGDNKMKGYKCCPRIPDLFLQINAEHKKNVSLSSLPLSLIIIILI